MANTRINYDVCRTVKKLQQSTDPGRWVLNVPGNGDHPCYMEDPNIILQKWGGNLRTNSISLESDLRGLTRKNTKDCLGVSDYRVKQVDSQAIEYPSCRDLSTEQSRATLPAWMFRDLEQVDWYTLPLDPQENTCMPFENNTSTRILEKDYFVRQRYC